MPPRSKTPDEPDATTAAGDLTDLTDDQLAEQTEQAAVDAGSEVRLAVAHPYDSLVIHELDGLEITSDGTLVPADQEQAIRAAASDAGVRIRKVK